MQTSSKLDLIDLAGGERQKSTGASRDPLKEGAQINLSALGNAMNALAEPGRGNEEAQSVHGFEADAFVAVILPVVLHDVECRGSP